VAYITLDILYTVFLYNICCFKEVHLGFPKTWFLITRSPWSADFPSLYQIWRKNVDRRRNYSPISKSKMAAVRHLGFVTSSYRTSYEVFSFCHIGLSNFMLIRCTVLKIWRFEIFADLAWNAYSRPKNPKNFGFWGSEPLNVIGHHRDPQKAPAWPKPHSRANFGADRSTGATCARDEEIKKRKKGEERNLQWQTRCSPRLPTLTQRYVVLRAGWSSGGSYKLKFPQNLLHGFRDVGVEICHFLYLRPVAYVTACTTVYKPWWSGAVSNDLQWAIT